MQRLAQQLDFVREIDRLKQVVRHTLLLDGSRCENSAEHTFQLALMAVVLCEYAEPEVALDRVLPMLLVHDLVEIDAGDTYLFDESGQADKSAREELAAQRIFALLPQQQGLHLRALWREFEAQETPEARFAAALDRLQPMLHNLETGGRQWRAHGVTYAKVAANARRVRPGAPRLYDYLRERLQQAHQKGFFAPAENPATPDYA